MLTIAGGIVLAIIVLTVIYLGLLTLGGAASVAKSFADFRRFEKWKRKVGLPR